MAISVRRLADRDIDKAQDLFLLIASVFGTPASRLSERTTMRLLASTAFWALAAFSDDDLVGGLTAHTLPMTRDEGSEIFIYDIAVKESCQRQGIGSLLVSHLRQIASTAGTEVVFVPADNDDRHALDFYRAIGGSATPVTIFTFGE